MISKKTSNEFLSYLLFLSSSEKEIECMRQVLNEIPGFEPYAAFLRMDIGHKRLLTASDIMEFLLANEASCELVDAERIIKFHDADQDRCLVFSEFLHMVLPQDNPFLRTNVAQRPNYSVRGNEQLPYEIEYGLTKVMEAEIHYGKEMSLRQYSLSKLLDFSVSEVFHGVDYKFTGFIDYENLAAFLSRSHVEFGDEEILGILKRMDLDGDGRISLDEFSYHFLVDRPKRLAAIERKSEKPQRPFEFGSLRVKQESQNHKAETNLALLNEEIPEQMKPQERQSQSSVPKERTEKKQNQAECNEWRNLHKRELGKKEGRMARSLKETIEDEKRDKADLAKLRGLSPIEVIFYYLKELLAQEKELETIKRDLTLTRDFNLMDFFRFFDESAAGFIEEDDLEQGLKELSIDVTRAEAKILLFRLDSEGLGRMRLSSFSKVFLPVDEMLRKVLLERQGINSKGRKPISIIFTPRTIEIAKDLLAKTLKYEREWERIRHQILKRKMDLGGLFDLIDLDKDGLLSPENVGVSFYLNEYSLMCSL